MASRKDIQSKLIELNKEKLKGGVTAKHIYTIVGVSAETFRHFQAHINVSYNVLSNFAYWHGFDIDLKLTKFK